MSGRTKKMMQSSDLTADERVQIYSELNKINLPAKMIRTPYNISSSIIHTHNTIYLEEAKKKKYFAPAPRKPKHGGAGNDDPVETIYTFYY